MFSFARATATVLVLASLFFLAALVSTPAGAQSPGHQGKPRSVVATPVSTTEISLNWRTSTWEQTSPHGFAVSVRKVWPFPAQPSSTPACEALNRSGSQDDLSRVATECVIRGLEPGANYEIQIVEQFRSGDSEPATAWSGTFVHRPTDLTIRADWSPDGSAVLVGWLLPANRKNISHHGARLYDQHDRRVGSCFRTISQRPSCEFARLADGGYRVEAFTYGGFGVVEPLHGAIELRRPAPTLTELDLEATWRSSAAGELFINVSWNHIDGASSAEYEVEIRDEECEATATETPQRITCEVPIANYGVSYPVEAELSGGNIEQTLLIDAPPPHPAHPANVSVTAVAPFSADVAWDHPEGSNATSYTVWMSNAAPCSVEGPFVGRQTCRLDGLQPGTSYVANVYADSAIGRRSIETIRVRFTTAAAPQFVVENLCTDDTKAAKRRDRVVNSANTRFEAGVKKAHVKLQDKPKKLERKIAKLKKTRNQRIQKANQTFNTTCAN